MGPWSFIFYVNHCFLKFKLFKNISSGNIRISETHSLETDQIDGPDLDPNCLQGLSLHAGIQLMTYL